MGSLFWLETFPAPDPRGPQPRPCSSCQVRSSFFIFPHEGSDPRLYCSNVLPPTEIHLSCLPTNLPSSSLIFPASHVALFYSWFRGAYLWTSSSFWILGHSLRADRLSFQLGSSSLADHFTHFVCPIYLLLETAWSSSFKWSQLAWKAFIISPCINYLCEQEITCIYNKLEWVIFISNGPKRINNEWLMYQSWIYFIALFQWGEKRENTYWVPLR